MKKVGILTYHAAHNYGSMLQAAALSRVISGLGTECRIIHFRPRAQTEKYAIIRKQRNMKAIIRSAFNVLMLQKAKRRFRGFEAFMGDNMALTEPLDEEALVNSPPVFDYYVCGSDQVWAKNSTEFSFLYMLSFVTSGKRISYAPCVGFPDFDGEHTKKFSFYAGRFDHISLRESESKELVETLAGKPVSVVLDPVYLLDKQEFVKMAAPLNIKEPYILFYSLYPSKTDIAITRYISKKLGLPVINPYFANGNLFFSGFKHRHQTTPSEFLWLIMHAKIVITSSFHGSVLSTIFKTPLYLLNPHDGRLKEVNSFYESDRYLTAENYKTRTDYFDVPLREELLTEKIRGSMEYLKQALDILN